MNDNKVRLSRDVLEKAETIAAEWGLKNARAAIEAVFRCYCDVYRQGQQTYHPGPPAASNGISNVKSPLMLEANRSSNSVSGQCDALDALDELLAL